MATLLYGDCLEKMKGMTDKSVDLIICDLPFGCLVGGGGKEKASRNLTRYVDGEPTENRAVYNGGVIAGCAWDIKIDLEVFWKEIKRIRKNEHTPCLMFCTTKFGFELYNSNPKEFRYDLVWDKERGVSFLSANKMPMRSHEMIYVFSKAGAKYNRVDIEGKPYIMKRKECVNKQYNVIRTNETINTGTRCVLSVINKSLAEAKHKGGHPTEKPIDLYKFLIERYSDVGDTILDPTFGSCNSGIASIELRRKYIGVEKDNRFYWKAVNKIV
jgi:site-specific DNA-methyltransferase (adenine-specific)